MTGFGTTPTSTTTLGANQFPINAVASPDTPSGNLTAVAGAPGAYQDANNNPLTAALFQLSIPRILQSNHAVTGVGGKTLNCQFANKNYKRNSIVVCVGMGEVEIGGGSPITLTITDANGNTYTEVTPTGSQSTTLEAAIFYATNIAADSSTPNTVTVTIAGSGSSNTAIGVEIYEIYGLIDFTPAALDQSANGNNAGSTSVSTGALAPVVPNELIFTVIAAAGGTITAGSGWTLDSGSLSPTGGNLVSFGSQSRLHGGIASLTPAATLSASNAWASASASFRGVILPIEGTVLQGSPPWRFNAQSGDIADGAIATIGTKADAFDITSGNTDTLMAFIKGIIKLLNTPTASAVPSNADYMGLDASTSLPSAATAGNLVGAMGDKFGRVVMLLNAMRDIVSPMTQLTLTSTTTETTLISSVASTFLDLVAVIIINTSATATQVDFRDSTAGTIRASAYVPAGDMRGVALPVPLPQNTSNNNWTAKCGTSVASIIITGLYISNK